MQVKKAVLAAISAGALVGLAACGGSGGNSDPGSEQTFNEAGESGKGQDQSQVDGPVEIDGATEGGTVTVLSYAGLTTMDPTEAYYVNTGSILSNLVVRSLTQYVYDEESGETTLIPDLATKWESNDDFTEWTFTLREGVKYETGDEVAPEDYIWGLKRAFDRDTFPGGAAYNNEYFEGGDKYQGPYTDPDGEWEGATVDGNELTIKMSKPFPDMPYWGAFPAISPIPEDASDPADYQQHPLATGPYMFDDYTPGESLTLVQNPEWDPATDPGRTQYPDEYDFSLTEDSTALDAKIIGDQGEAQTTLTYDDVLQSDWAKAQETGNTVTGGVPCTRFWYLDYRKITDINVRKAIGLAYPYKDQWLTSGEIVGVTRIPGDSIMPPGIPGKPSYDILGNGGQETDPAKAKQMLQEAGEEGYQLDFLFAADDPISVDVKNVLVEAYEEAGFDPNPIASTINKIPTQNTNPDTPINIRSGGWCQDWPTGSSWIPPLFGPNGSANYSQFDEKSVNDEIQEIILLPQEEQADAWGALDERISTDYYPLVNIGFYGGAQLHGSRIQGHFIDETAGMPTWKNIWISEE